MSALASLARAGAPSRYARALADAVRSRAATLDAYARVRAAGIPVIVVHAARETPVEDVRGATGVSIDAAGHNPHLTHTTEVARAALAFLRKGGHASLSPAAP